MEAPEDDVMIESELDLDDLVEENFELRDPGCSKSRLHKKINLDVDSTTRGIKEHS